MPCIETFNVPAPLTGRVKNLKCHGCGRPLKAGEKVTRHLRRGKNRYYCSKCKKRLWVDSS